MTSSKVQWDIFNGIDRYAGGRRKVLYNPPEVIYINQTINDMLDIGEILTIIPFNFYATQSDINYSPII